MISLKQQWRVYTVTHVVTMLCHNYHCSVESLHLHMSASYVTCQGNLHYIGSASDMYL